MRAFACAMLVGAGLIAGAAAAPPPARYDIAIKMQKETFAPAAAKVAAGTTIVWTNADSVPHSVTADDKRFDSGAIAPGQTFTWTADQAGTIRYHCIFHPSMTATLTVTAGSGKKTG